MKAWRKCNCWSQELVTQKKKKKTEAGDLGDKVIPVIVLLKLDRCDGCFGTVQAFHNTGSNVPSSGCHVQLGIAVFCLAAWVLGHLQKAGELGSAKG